MTSSTSTAERLAAPQLSTAQWLILNLIPLALALFYRLAYPPLVVALELPAQYASILMWALTLGSV